MWHIDIASMACCTLARSPPCRVRHPDGAPTHEQFAEGRRHNLTQILTYH